MWRLLYGKQLFFRHWNIFWDLLFFNSCELWNSLRIGYILEKQYCSFFYLNLVYICYCNKSTQRLISKVFVISNIAMVFSLSLRKIIDSFSCSIVFDFKYLECKILNLFVLDKKCQFWAKIASLKEHDFLVYYRSSKCINSCSEK